MAFFAQSSTERSHKRPSCWNRVQLSFTGRSFCTIGLAVVLLYFGALYGRKVAWIAGGWSFNFGLYPAWLALNPIEEGKPPTHHKTYNFRQLGTPSPPHTTQILCLGTERKKKVQEVNDLKVEKGFTVVLLRIGGGVSCWMEENK